MRNTGPSSAGEGSYTFQKHYSQVTWLSRNEAWLQLPALFKLTVQQPTRYIFQPQSELFNEKWYHNSKLPSKILSKNLHLTVNQGFLRLHAKLICVYMCGFLERSHSVQRIKSAWPKSGLKVVKTTLKGRQNFFLWVILGNEVPWWLSGKESTCIARDSRDAGSTPGLGRSPGEGNGNPLQYSHLGNMDRGAWRVTVHEVARSQTQLSKHAKFLRATSGF